jgi:hypothetical protein
LAEITDIDFYGQNLANGQAVEYMGTDAVGNALYLWMTSKKGEFLYNPAAGGILDKSLFKTMSPDNLANIQFYLYNSILNFFSPYIELRDLILEPDMNSRILNITIKYFFPQTNQSGSVSIYVQSDYANKSYTYEDVDYVGSNLINFCRLQKTDMLNDKLVFNPDTDLWSYGKYIFINLTTSSSEFETVLLICNGS